MTLLRVEHVVKKFGGLRAVDDVSFALDRGEFLAVVAPNGSGKTTSEAVHCIGRHAST